MQSMSCKNIVMKEVDAYLTGHSSLENVKLIVANYCPNLKERNKVLNEVKQKLEKFFESVK